MFTRASVMITKVSLSTIMHYVSPLQTFTFIAWAADHFF